MRIGCLEETIKPLRVVHMWSIVFPKKKRVVLDTSHLSKLVHKTRSHKMCVPTGSRPVPTVWLCHIQPSCRNHSYFVWEVLFLGLNIAPWLFTTLCKPLIKFWRSQLKIDCPIFRDDLIKRENERQAQVSRYKVKEVLSKGGWIWNEKKGREPSQLANYLGFLIDSKQLLFKIHIKKKQVRKAVAELLEQDVSVRHLVRVTGKLIALVWAVGPVCRLMMRNQYRNIHQAASWSSWIDCIGIKNQAGILDPPSGRNKGIYNQPLQISG